MTVEQRSAPPADRSITMAFPRPGRMVAQAYRDLALAQEGTKEEKQQLGSFDTLPRPWDPPSCPGPLRAEVWAWLDDVAMWVNRSYVWQVDRGIPACWPGHPHIAHELAVLADQRLHAGRALNSTALEDWHRYSLPAFLDRLAARLEQGCASSRGHDDWPAEPRYRRQASTDHVRSRAERFAMDTRSTTRPSGDTTATPARPNLMVVDLDSGELHDPAMHDAAMDHPEGDYR